MGRSKARLQLEMQKQQALKQLQQKQEELEELKRRYSEVLRAGIKQQQPQQLGDDQAL